MFYALWVNSTFRQKATRYSFGFNHFLTSFSSKKILEYSQNESVLIRRVPWTRPTFILMSDLNIVWYQKWVPLYYYIYSSEQLISLRTLEVDNLIYARLYQSRTCAISNLYCESVLKLLIGIRKKILNWRWTTSKFL